MEARTRDSSEFMIQEFHVKLSLTDEVRNYSTVGKSPGRMLKECFAVWPEICSSKSTFQVVIVTGIKQRISKDKHRYIATWRPWMLAIAARRDEKGRVYEQQMKTGLRWISHLLTCSPAAMMCWFLFAIYRISWLVFDHRTRQSYLMKAKLYFSSRTCAVAVLTPVWNMADFHKMLVHLVSTNEKELDWFLYSYKVTSMYLKHWIIPINQINPLNNIPIFIYFCIKNHFKIYFLLRKTRIDSCIHTKWQWCIYKGLRSSIGANWLKSCQINHLIGDLMVKTRD